MSIQTNWPGLRKTPTTKEQLHLIGGTGRKRFEDPQQTEVNQNQRKPK